MAIDNLADLVTALRNLADRLESSAPPLTPRSPRAMVSVGIHFVRDRATLRAWSLLLDDPKPGHNCGTHWVRGSVAGIDVSLYYDAGLLGRTRTQKIVLQEDQPDLAGLLSEEPEPATAQ